VKPNNSIHGLEIFRVGAEVIAVGIVYSGVEVSVVFVGRERGS